MAEGVSRLGQAILVAASGRWGGARGATEPHHRADRLPAAWRATRSCTAHSPHAWPAVCMPSLDYGGLHAPRRCGSTTRTSTRRRTRSSPSSSRRPNRARVAIATSCERFRRRSRRADSTPIHLSAVLLIVIFIATMHSTFFPSTSHERVIPGWTDRGARRGLRVVCVRLAPAHSRPPWLCLALFMRAR